MTDLRFPFGLPVTERKPFIFEPRLAYILGAYPSALHVRWVPPSPYRVIKAIAVDDEPETFWNGQAEEGLIEAWKESVHFDPDWGEIFTAGRLNGSSGLWVDEKVLKPLGLERGKSVWLSDCLETYRLSSKLLRRLEDTYTPFAEEMDLPEYNLQPHPSEEEIVCEALEDQLDRICEELEEAKPSIIITLGNAALRVMRQILGTQSIPEKLVPSEALYGKPVDIAALGGKEILLCLAHPAAPKQYQIVHDGWIKRLPEII